MLYNGHIHVFNSHCVPDDFLKVGIPGARFDGLADNIKNGLETKLGRKLVKWSLAHGQRKGKVKRLLTFFDIGIEASQRRVFERLHEVYKGHNPVYFLLTLNMDHMTDEVSSHANFETQLQEVFFLKATYPKELQVFLSCDPRYKQGNALRDWFANHYESGRVAGIKLYPALGFFPFDPAMEALYAYANQHKIPILTHTTRTGAFYLGKGVRELVGTRPASFDPQHQVMEKIYARIDRYRKSNERKLKLNDFYCNIFSHPENYLPVLDHFPDLKLCLAHYGGTNEILGKTANFMQNLEEDKSKTWTDHIRSMMLRYDNLYTDISYSLAEKETHAVFKKDMRDPKLSERIFFGTDYFMEEQEKSEQLVFKEFRDSFINENEMYLKMTQANPKRFLGF